MHTQLSDDDSYPDEAAMLPRKGKKREEDHQRMKTGTYHIAHKAPDLSFIRTRNSPNLRYCFRMASSSALSSTWRGPTTRENRRVRENKQNPERENVLRGSPRGGEGRRRKPGETYSEEAVPVDAGRPPARGVRAGDSAVGGGANVRHQPGLGGVGRGLVLQIPHRRRRKMGEEEWMDGRMDEWTNQCMVKRVRRE